MYVQEYVSWLVSMNQLAPIGPSDAPHGGNDPKAGEMTERRTTTGDARRTDICDIIMYYTEDNGNLCILLCFCMS